MIGPRTEQAISSAKKNRFYLIGPYRVLAYGNRKGDGLHSLTADEAELFNEQELAWLENAIQREAAAKASRDWGGVEERSDQFLRRFEEELEVERRRLEDGDATKEAGNR
jgi:hypothetical protein